MKKLVILIALFFTTACTVTHSEDFTAPQDVSPETTSKPVGPYEVGFDQNNNYENNFEIPINQSEGKVEYFVPANLNGRLVLENYQATLTGCEVEVAHSKIAWFSDSNASSGIYVKSGSQLPMIKDKRGLLLISFTGIETCTNVSVSLKLHLNPAATPSPTPPSPSPTPTPAPTPMPNPPEHISFFSCEGNNGSQIVTQFAFSDLRKGIFKGESFKVRMANSSDILVAENPVQTKVTAQNGIYSLQLLDGSGKGPRIETSDYKKWELVTSTNRYACQPMKSDSLWSEKSKNILIDCGSTGSGLSWIGLSRPGYAWGQAFYAGKRFEIVPFSVGSYPVFEKNNGYSLQVASHDSLSIYIPKTNLEFEKENEEITIFQSKNSVYAETEATPSKCVLRSAK